MPRCRPSIGARWPAGRCRSSELHAELDAAWESTGFLTREHEEARKAAARDTLERFWTAQQADPATPDRRRAGVRGPVRARPGARALRPGRHRCRRPGHDHRLQVERRAGSGHRGAARPRVAAARRSTALAWEAQHGRPPDDLALHFLESGIEGHSAPARSAWRAPPSRSPPPPRGSAPGSFEATPSPTRCGYCPFREICPDAIR